MDLRLCQRTPAHRSAIVSFWARHRDGRGGFAGRDEWSFASLGGMNISAGIGGTEAGRWVIVRMPAGTTNVESAQLWQYLELRRGVRYDVCCRMRWDDFAPDVATPIVNYGIYHEASRTWYGPVDQVLQRRAGD